MEAYEREHLDMLRGHLADCAVLLKTDGAFPLEKPCPLAAYGSGVRRTVKGGIGSGEVNSRFFVTVEQGLTEAGFTLTTGPWLDGYDAAWTQARTAFLKALKAEARAHHTNVFTYGMGKSMPEPEYDLPLTGSGDAAVYVLSRNSGEGSDRDPVPGDILLTASEIRDILALNQRFGRFMLVLNVGGPVDLGPVMEVGNILLLSQLGVETGAALADILLGRANPSGKLTTTWARWEDYPTVGTFGDHDDTEYKEGIYVGYRYFEAAEKKPLFPFGYGLSYTTFALSPVETTLTGSVVTCRVQGQNAGDRPGREVVQLYVSAPEGKLDRPRQELAAFAKTKLLQPGETETVEAAFDLRDCAAYDMKRSAYILEAGDYVVRIGNRSDATRPVAILRLAREVVTLQARPCCGTASFEDWRPAPRKPELLPELPVLAMDPAAIKTVTVPEARTYAIEESLRSLSDELLVHANVGSYSSGLAAILPIGDSGVHVAGAAGETTSKLKDAGLPPLVMADGPAGLRLSRRFYRDKKGGAHAVGQSTMPESVTELMGSVVKFFANLIAGEKKPPKDAQIQEQYCTAIPIGTAIAQSWDVAFAQACGDLVGDEMERFHVHLWLAPALNIHRTIRCGRNFEYFSEDPLIGGKMAAALTRGVQAHPGRGTTVKHFAANNQEYNRYGSNSLVSERALREIYLKGFGIAVRESQPKALMTSYNLINGDHTAQRRDLIEDVLRCEFGFEGIVMTDWVLAFMDSKLNKYPATKPHKVAAAGGDLFMPGCKADYDDILRALREGTLSREQLLVNVSRLYRLAQEMTGERG
ncbi:MAG: glycoside hydrolase family 3 C-terminal domain-containing protein [Clostridia bacterium]|nr:glycoside hydrolase family 3 C-terminal domain-containing protein [Clostridia bacterium]